MVNTLAANKLTGAFNAISGGNLTDITTPHYKSASNPTFTSAEDNSLPLGTLWVNHSTGNVFACINTTAGNNQWKNLGTGTGNIS
jgi:hypothetical protein